MEDKVSLTNSDIVHRSKSQIILFYGRMNKANGVRKICKLLSNWPVRFLKPCQTTVRKRESRGQSQGKNYWISFSCYSLPISLSNFSSHQDHGSVLHAWRADFSAVILTREAAHLSPAFLLHTLLAQRKTQILPVNKRSRASLHCRWYQEGIFKCWKGGKKTLGNKTVSNTSSSPHRFKIISSSFSLSSILRLVIPG